MRQQDGGAPVGPVDDGIIVKLFVAGIIVCCVVLCCENNQNSGLTRVFVAARFHQPSESKVKWPREVIVDGD